MNFRCTAEPTEEPVALAEMKLFLRISSSTENELIRSLLVAARRACERHTKRAFMTQTWEMVLDQFPAMGGGRGGDWWDGTREMPLSMTYGDKRYIELPLSPLQSLTSLTTYDMDDSASLMDLTQLVVSVDRTPGRIALKPGAVWPVATRGVDAVKIVWVAGYGSDPLDVPMDLKHAIKLLTAHFYEFRQPVEVAKAGGALEMPWSVDALLRPYVVMSL